MTSLNSGAFLLLLLCSLFIFLSLALIKVLLKLWWNPLQINGKMASQGIKGPPYKFFHGSTKEMLQMKKEVAKRPMNLSHDIFPYIQPHLHRWSKTYGKNFLMWYGTQAHLVVSDPKLVREVLNNRDNTYKKVFLQDQVRKLIGDGLVTSEGQTWAKHRKLANFAFHGQSLKSMVLVMVDCAHMMFKRWGDREGKEIDVFEEFKVYTTDVIFKTTFGSTYIEGKSKFENAIKLGLLKIITSSKIRFSGTKKLWNTAEEIEAEELEKGSRDAVLNIIKQRQEKVKTGESRSYGNDFLGLLLQASHDANEKKKITTDNVIAECKTFYIAGHESSTSLLAWTIFLLAIHRDWQEEARKEVLIVFGNQDPHFEGITKLKMMSMIINESLRLYSPVIGISRKVSRPAKLGKLILPTGITIYIPTLKIHHDPQIWGDDPHFFKPDRFSNRVTNSMNNNPAAFLPFGLGPRSCVGLNFATMEAKVILSMILQRHAFTLSPAYIHSPVQLVTACPQYGIQVIFSPV